MAIVTPFRGLRYDPTHVGALAHVIAPASDAIDAALRNELYERHPANVVRLECNRPEPGDDVQGSGHARAARFLRAWREQGVLMREPAAALYVHHQEYEWDGATTERRGVMARVRLDPPGTGSTGSSNVHHRTLSGQSHDRLCLTRACRTQIGPVLGLYPDDDREVQALLDAAVAGQPPVEATDSLGGTSRLWPVTDEAIAAKVAGLLGPKPVLVADGHHHHAAACAHRDEVAAAWQAEHDGAPLPGDHPANFVLMMLVGTGDPGLLVLPAHRLFVEPAVPSAAELCKRLAPCFTTRTSWRGPEATEAVWANLDLEGDQGVIGLYTAGDRAWTIARITPAGRGRMEALAADLGTVQRGLGVTILQRLVIGDLLRPSDTGVELPPPACAHRLEDVREGLGSGRYPLGALVMPVSIADLRAVTAAGERLPPQSGRFHPPVPTGLVLNPLE
jgi:uncharacterized protein (DUF1015 family)